MAKKVFDFKIDTEIFNEFEKIKETLPEHAPRTNGIESYCSPSGLALLGAKNNLVDKVVNLKMAGGCWDAPAVTFDGMSKALTKMVKEDRIVVGMALIRSTGWDIYNKIKMPLDMSNNIRKFKRSFEDITKTVWMVIGKDYYRIYRVKKDVKSNRLRISEVKTTATFKHSKEDEENLFIRRGKKDKELQEARKARAKALEEAIKRKKEEEIKRKKQLETQKKKEKEEKGRVDKELKEGKKDIIRIPNSRGLCYLKDKSGMYILWKEQ